MYSALVELMQPEIDEAVQKARNEASNVMEARKTVEAVDNAIRKLNMSKEKACKFMDITPAQYDAYVKIYQNTKKGD